MKTDQNPVGQGVSHFNSRDLVKTFWKNERRRRPSRASRPGEPGEPPHVEPSSLGEPFQTVLQTPLDAGPGHGGLAWSDTKGRSPPLRSRMAVPG